MTEATGSWLRLAGRGLQGVSHLIDRRLGLETTQAVTEATLGYEHAGQLRPYEPSRWFALRAALRRDEVSDEDVFADLGCGKGRIVLEAAAHYPFRRVLGVERSGELSDIACANLRSTRRRLRCAHVDIITADATQWLPPDDLSIVYLFNPFTGDVFSSVLARLIDHVNRTARPLRVVYAHPVEHEALLSSGQAHEMPVPNSRMRRLLGIPDGWLRRYELTPAG